MAIGLVVVSVLTAGYAAWAYHVDVHFRNDIKVLLFNLAVSGVDRKVLLLGDSRIAAMSCPSDFDGWQVLNLGISGSTADDWSAFVAARGKLGRFDAAVLWVGINDILNMRRAGASVARDVINLLRNLDTFPHHVVLINPRDALANNTVIAQRIQHEVGVLADILASTVDIDRVSILTPFETSPNVVSSVYADGIHLNIRGYRILCAELGYWLAKHG